MQQVQRATTVPHAKETVWNWHARPGAFERLSPPWRSVDVLGSGSGIEKGGGKTLRVPVGPAHVTAEFEHVDVAEGHSFIDEQKRGPFAHWRHEHRFVANGPLSTTLVDRIEYELPAGRLGRVAAGEAVSNELERLLRFRHAVVTHDLDVHARSRLEPRRIAITGTSGLIGTQLVAFLSAAGHEVIRMVRREPTHSNEVRWDPQSGIVPSQALEGLDTVIHLAGENLSAGRWTRQRRAAILNSRVAGTSALARTLAGLNAPPRTFISASAIGIYGDRGDTVLSEDAPHGEGFLSDVCAAWEQAAAPAREAGIRVVHPRLGIVMSMRGGMLARVTPLFRLGLGGRLASGKQWVSWIALDDLLAMMLHIIGDDSIEGPLNAVAPQPITNAKFTTELASQLHRPAMLPVPESGLRLVFGELAGSLLLASQRVVPSRLEQSDFSFTFPAIEDAICHELGGLPESEALARAETPVYPMKTV